MVTAFYVRRSIYGPEEKLKVEVNDAATASTWKLLEGKK